MMQNMRTTLTIDDQLAKALKEAAQRSDKSFKDIVNETLRAGLMVQRALPKAKLYKVKPTSLGGVKPGIDLVKALALADQLEAEELVRKLQMKK
jgi:hypothetical protein